MPSIEVMVTLDGRDGTPAAHGTGKEWTYREDSNTAEYLTGLIAKAYEAGFAAGFDRGLAKGVRNGVSATRDAVRKALPDASVQVDLKSEDS